jgi:ATP-dependent Lhr-like helicase
LREVRRRPHDGALLSISGADPLNLSGILTPGAKLPALTGNRAVYRDGLPVALSSGGREQYLEALDDSARWAVRKALLKGPAPARLAELA